MRNRSLFILIILLFCAQLGYSQYKKRKQIEYSGFFDSYFFRGPFNYYASLGTSAYFGDLCGSLDCNVHKPAFGVGANYNMWSRVLIGAEYNYFGLSSVDEIVERNLGFKSRNHEFLGYARFEIIYNRILKHSERTKKPKLIKPYIMLGAAMVNYKAETYSVGSGTGDTLTKESIVYPRWSFVIPTGLGIKFSFSRRLALVTQVNYRITFTDYLDEVSELRGSTENKDAYASVNISVEFTPGAKRMKPKKHRSHGDDEEGGGSGGSAPTNNDSDNTPADNTTPTDNNTDTIPEEPVEESLPEPTEDDDEFIEEPTDDDEYLDEDSTEDDTSDEEPEEDGYEEWDESDDSDDTGDGW